MNQFECIFCRRNYPADPMHQFCPDCGEALLCRQTGEGRHVYHDKSNPLERYLDFLPMTAVDHSLHLGEGNSPFTKLDRIMKQYDLPETFAKNETTCPTASFKDRGTTVALQMAVQRGIQEIGTVSTGNMGISTAAYGARSGVRTHVLIKEDTTREKLVTVSIHGPNIIKVSGDYGELARRSFEIGKRCGIYFMNGADPFRIEGYKVIGFEIFEQLNHESPTHIVVPTSSGAHLVGLMKAYRELFQQGLVAQTPKFIGVQADGCAPMAHAFAAGRQRFEKVTRSATIAQSITNPDPPAGNIALQWVGEMGGTILSVSDDDMLSAQKALAELEGLFCLPESATTLAGMLKLHKKGAFNGSDRVVLVITGSGTKNLGLFETSELPVRHSTLEDIENHFAGAGGA
jgi:threonine synthase